MAKPKPKPPVVVKRDDLNDAQRRVVDALLAQRKAGQQK